MSPQSRILACALERESRLGTARAALASQLFGQHSFVGGGHLMSWGGGLQRLATAFGVLTSSIVAMPSPEQRVLGILRSLSGKALTAREVALESGLPLKEVYSTLGSLYERRAVSTHPSGCFWVGAVDLPLDRLFEARCLRAPSQDVEFPEVTALSA